MAKNQKDKVAKAGLYNRLNSPSSTDVARARLDDLDTVIERITHQLENEQSEKWTTEDEFNFWHNAASRACGHHKAERAFISAWLSAQSQPHLAKRLFISSEKTRLSGAEQLTVNVQKVAQNLEKKLADLMAIPVSTLGFVEKELLIRALRELLEEVGAALQDANNRAQALYVGRTYLPELRKPLMDFKQKVMHILYPPSLTKTGDFLVALVDRAIKEGFVLSPTEIRRLEQIRKQYADT
jgi:hypothetical protein